MKFTKSWIKVVITVMAVMSALWLLPVAGLPVEQMSVPKWLVYMLCVYALDRFYSFALWFAVLMVKPAWVSRTPD